MGGNDYANLSAKAGWPAKTPLSAVFLFCVSRSTAPIMSELPHDPTRPPMLKRLRCPRVQGTKRKRRIKASCRSSVAYHNNQAERWMGRGMVKRHKKLPAIRRKMGESELDDRQTVIWIVSRRRAATLEAKKVKRRAVRVLAESKLQTLEERAALREGVSCSPLRSLVQARKAG